MSKAKKDESTKLENALYVVPTPIGNLDDITLRAINVLKHADVIAAEDTRHTKILLDRLGIKPAKLISCHDHNEDEKAEALQKLLSEGKSVALVSDAGTPLICDPGYRVIRLLIERNNKVVALPGPCAVITALTVSGLPADRFRFGGFLPTKEEELRGTLTNLRGHLDACVFYESPHRIVRTLEILADIMPDRHVVLCRELTKTFESVYRMTASKLRDFILEDEKRQKGEFVLIVGGDQKKPEVTQDVDKVMDMLVSQKMALKDACKIASSIYGLNKNELYKYMLNKKES